MKLQNVIKKTLVALVLTGSVCFISCTDKVCSAYAKSGQDSYSKQKNMDVRNTNQSVPSPYNDKYKAKILEKQSAEE